MSHVDSRTMSLGLPHRRRVGVRRLAILVSLGLMLLAVVASLFLVRTVDSQLADIANTYEIRRQARELMLAIVDAETGQRGYLLTRDEAYLTPYNAAVANMSGTYDQLSVLLRDSPTQAERLAAIAPDIEAKRAEMAHTIELMSAGQVPEALALLRSDAGRELMDRIRTHLRALIAEEDDRLVERNAAVAIYRQSLVATTLAALIAAAALAYALLSRSQRRVDALAEQQSALRTQNEELEARVRARTAEVEEARARSERERERVEALLQDTNHRIGNSLATVSSLLGLQLARSSSDEVRNALEAAQARVQAIASGHRRLRLGADLETTNAAEFLDDVTEDLAQGVPPGSSVSFVRDFEPLTIPARDATTIGIVVSELATNACKHAFGADGKGTIWVRFGRGANGVVTLAVEDDGQGMQETGNGRSGLGALIVRQVANQFGGAEPRYAPRPGGGTSVTVELPKLEVRNGS
ncbi:MAG: CHASE3 domain-containing protein [Devosia sp.]|uniref:CHASE3 domain-containing protein n=1 Tax=Devosia sp. TaxID=1871048 RepID=UPI001AC1EDCA|nr:CHASE3 domain-containing protein [Devosia sp.]MBN9315524.1 CHASE3 domain-containing protein [Devosia sp.]